MTHRVTPRHVRVCAEQPVDVCSVSHLQEDYELLRQHISRRLPATVQPLPAELRHTNEGTASREAQDASGLGTAEPQIGGQRANPYLPKYMQCGHKCVHNVRTYYAEDMMRLQFPVRRPRTCASWLAAWRPALALALPLTRSCVAS